MVSKRTGDEAAVPEGAREGEASTEPSGDVHALYQELCKSLHVIDDFRARLLALLPLSSGAGIFLLLATTNSDDQAKYLRPIGLIGGLISFGLFVYELRQMIVCGHLLKVGTNLEEAFGFSEGQFLGRPTPSLAPLLVALQSRRRASDSISDRRSHDFKWWYVFLPSVPMASCIVYLTVIAGWAYLALSAE